MKAMSANRMGYHKEFCGRHYQGYTTGELTYMCDWYGVISSREIALALGRTQNAVLRKVRKLKESGEFGYYKKRQAVGKEGAACHGLCMSTM